MPKCVNISRLAARKWEYYRQKYNLTDGDFAWISISEPDQPDTVVSNPILDKYPNLKISFWDTTFNSVLTDIKNGTEIKYHPPSYSDARKIVNFLLKNDGRDIIAQCAAGYSRSTAICKFCEDVLGYKWLEGEVDTETGPKTGIEKHVKNEKSQYWGKKWSDPNPVLYQKMVDYYNFPILSYFSDEKLDSFSIPPKSGVIPSEIKNDEEGNP